MPLIRDRNVGNEATVNGGDGVSPACVSPPRTGFASATATSYRLTGQRRAARPGGFLYAIDRKKDMIISGGVHLRRRAGERSRIPPASAHKRALARPWSAPGSSRAPARRTQPSSRKRTCLPPLGFRCRKACRRRRLGRVEVVGDAEHVFHGATETGELPHAGPRPSSCLARRRRAFRAVQKVVPRHGCGTSTTGTDR